LHAPLQANLSNVLQDKYTSVLHMLLLKSVEC